MYESFKNELIKELEKLTRETKMSVSFDSILKNNSQRKEVLIVRHTDVAIAPTIYLDSWYDEYFAGAAVDEIARDILLLAGKAFTYNKIPVIPEMTWESIKDKLYVSVINAEANKELLAETPYRMLEDLAIVPRINVSVNGDDIASIRITNSLLTLMGKTKDEVLNRAVANTEMYGFRCRSMNEVLYELMSDDSVIANELLPDQNAPTMYVVTSNKGIDGSAILACGKAMSSMIDSLGTDVYILPSSTHEILMIPKNTNVSIEDLRLMVHEVNCTEVMPEEVLSDNVYQYNTHTKKLCIAVANVEDIVESKVKSKILKM